MIKSFFSGIILCSFLCFHCEKNEEGPESENNEPVTNTDWNLVWSDEFEGTILDQSKWNILRWRPGWFNN